jgi:hypothetical protein
MAYYAFINAEKIVVGVIPGRDEFDVVDGISDWEAYYASKHEGITVKRTSYNTRGGVHYDPATGEPSADQSKTFRGNYAGIGFTYDEALDAFIPPRPSEDATLDETTFSWVVPETETE